MQGKAKPPAVSEPSRAAQLGGASFSHYSRQSSLGRLKAPPSSISNERGVGLKPPWVLDLGLGPATLDSTTQLITSSSVHDWRLHRLPSDSGMCSGRIGEKQNRDTGLPPFAQQDLWCSVTHPKRSKDRQLPQPPPNSPARASHHPLPVNLALPMSLFHQGCHAAPPSSA